MRILHPGIKQEVNPRAFEIAPPHRKRRDRAFLVRALFLISMAAAPLVGSAVDEAIDPADPETYFDDEDGDGFPNAFELAAGSDAQNPLSQPAPNCIVDPDGGGTHGSIQDALDAVNADFQIVEVAPGTYRGERNTGLRIQNYAVLLRARSGAGRTVLDAEHLRHGIAVTSDAVIDGFTIRGGIADEGAGLAVTDATVRAHNCILTDNRARQEGGAIQVTDGELVLVHSTAFQNQAALQGSGLLATRSAVVIVNSIFWNASWREIANRDSVVSSAFSIFWERLAGESNLWSDPLLTPSGHLAPESSAINMGELVNASSFDADGELRPFGTASDIGADEFVDIDGDSLPDFWEKEHFGSIGTQNGFGDFDGDGVRNVDEYRRGLNPRKAVVSITSGTFTDRARVKLAKAYEDAGIDVFTPLEKPAELLQPHPVRSER